MNTVSSFQGVVADGTPQTVKLTPKENIPLGPVKAVYACGKHFIAYSDPQNQFWYVQDQHLDQTPDKKFNALWNSVQEVVALPRHNAPGMEEPVFKSVATALSCGVEKDFESADTAVAHARKTLLDASERRVKAWYLQTAAYSALALAVVGFGALFCCLEGGQSAAMQLKQLLAIGVAGGSVGALLSVLGPRRKSKVDPFCTQQEAQTDGFLRVLYGIVSGFIVAAAVHAEFVTSAVVKQSDSILPSLLVAIGGGFLERWAVDIIQSTRPPKPES